VDSTGDRVVCLVCSNEHYRNMIGDKMNATTLIPELDLDTVDLMVRTANRGLMVMFINHNPLERANLDVRHSIVFYDERHMFEYAMAEMPDEETQRKLLVHTTIRYWAKGV